MEREGFQMNTIAERIKFAMKAKNKKQVDIVKDTGISKGAFSSYLSGQYNPKADKMELIADSLDVDLRWLYGQNVPMEHTTPNDNALQYVFYNNTCLRIQNFPLISRCMSRINIFNRKCLTTLNHRFIDFNTFYS